MNNIFAMMQMIQQLKQNPSIMLKQAGYDIPLNMTNPNDIIQHLMNSGQITQQRFEQARQMASRYR